MSDTRQTQGFHLPTGFQAWALAAIVIWAVVGFGMLARGLGQVVEVVVPSLGSFFIAGLFIAIFRPITHWLKAHKFNDALAALSGVLAALIVMGLLLAMFLGPVIGGAAGFAAGIPSAMATINTKVQAVIASYQTVPPNVKQMLQNSSAALGSAVTKGATNGVGMLVASSKGLFSFGLDMFLALILTFWFLKDGPRIAAAILKVVPERFQKDVSVIASSFDRSFSGYLLATAINCSIIFILDGIGFAIIGLPYGWFVAAAVAILGIIPYMGSILSFLLAGVAGFVVGPQLGIETGIIVFVVDQIVYSFLGPIVAGKTVSLHPVMIIFSLCIGASLAGFLGAILAIPVAAAIRVVYIYYRDRDEAEAASVVTPEPTAVSE